MLLYGAELWVLNEQGRNKFKGFCNKCAHFLTGRYITKVNDEWINPETKKRLDLAYLLPIEEYTKNRKNSIKSYALDRDIHTGSIKKSL